MMLRSITLDNFKSFEGKTEIPLRRITSLIGKNGAGKPNILDGMQKISAIPLGHEYMPKPADYFDGDDDKAEMRLGVTFDLPNSVQQALLNRPKTRSSSTPREDLVGGPLFKIARHTVAFKSGAMQEQEICLSDGNEKLHPFVFVTPKGKKCDIDIRQGVLPGGPCGTGAASRPPRSRRLRRS